MKSIMRVLVIDDEAESRLAIQRALSRSGYEVLTAQDGPEGLDMARAHKPDLIILDILMPGMDGYQVCSDLIGDPFTNHIPILMLTTLSDKGNVIYGLRFGADAYLPKPFNPDELRIRVKNLIARSHHFTHISAPRPI